MKLLQIFQDCRYPMIPKAHQSFGHMVLSEYRYDQWFMHDLILVAGLEVYCRVGLRRVLQFKVINYPWCETGCLHFSNFLFWPRYW